jgi:hypothetical protein
VKAAPRLEREALLRDLQGQRVLERVPELGKQVRLVNELADLQIDQRLKQRLIRQLRHVLQQFERDFLPNDGRDLEEPFVMRGQPVDPGGEDNLNSWRYLEGFLHGADQSKPATLSLQNFGLYERAHLRSCQSIIAATHGAWAPWIGQGPSTWRAVGTMHDRCRQ